MSNSIQLRIKRRVLLAVYGVTLTLLVGCSEPPKIESIEGYAQGTSYQVLFWSEDKTPVSGVQTEFDTTLSLIDKELSTYRPDSYISEFNASPSLAWQTASPDFINLITTAKDIHRKSQGCYDPTVGPLFDLWGFKNASFYVPTSAEIAETKAKLGIDKIEVDATLSRVRKTHPTLALDFSSMGEGYTIGKLSKVLEESGVKNYMIQFGGDLKVKGQKPNGDQWRIAIQQPTHATAAAPKIYKIMNVIDEKGVTLDTSGTYNRYFDDNGVEYSHIINPNSGEPVKHNLVSASVLHRDGMLGDAWATAMLCLGPIEGKKIADQEKLEVFFIEKTSENFSDSSSTALLNTTKIKFVN